MGGVILPDRSEESIREYDESFFASTEPWSEDMAGRADCVDPGHEDGGLYDKPYVLAASEVRVPVLVPSRTNREGDTQGLPTVNDSKDIQSIVIDEILQRRKVGIKRYGTPLQANNGRDALRDAFEEALDLTMYLMQAIVERDNEAQDTP